MIWFHEIWDAFTAFTAARIESLKSYGENVKVVVHTGNWGTGAYGGNKTLMALLQILSAKFASIDVLYYHTFSAESTEKYNEAIKVYEEQVIKSKGILRIPELLSFINGLNFEWGVSDGN